MPATMHRIKRHQMRKGLSVARRIIDVDDLNVIPVKCRAHGQASHTSKTIDTYFDCHKIVLYLVQVLSEKNIKNA